MYIYKYYNADVIINGHGVDVSRVANTGSGWKKFKK